MTRDWIAVEVDKSLFKAREPLDDNFPDGYMISDKEWIENNCELCVQFLNSLGRRLAYERRA